MIGSELHRLMVLVDGTNVSRHKWDGGLRCRNCGIRRQPVPPARPHVAVYAYHYSTDNGATYTKERPTCPPTRP